MMPQKQILGGASPDKSPTVRSEQKTQGNNNTPYISVYGFGSRIWEKTVMGKTNDQKRMVKKTCPQGFPGTHKG